MKKIYNLLVLGVCLLGLNMAAQSEEEKAWMAYMTPGEPHKMLAEESGSWSCEMKFWMAPGAPAQTYQATAYMEMILGGRYQVSDYKGMVMGMPFEGKGTVAYDNADKIYVSTWIDNSGERTKMREVYTIVDKNTRKMEMFNTVDGKEFKTMEIIMKRKV